MNSGSTGEAASISQPTKSKFEENISFDTDNASEDPKESSGKPPSLRYNQRNNKCNV